MIRRPPRSTQSRSSAASDVYKRQRYGHPIATPRPVKDAGLQGEPQRGGVVLVELGRFLAVQRQALKEVHALTHVLVRVVRTCLLYTSDAADDLLCVDLGGRRIIN